MGKTSAFLPTDKLAQVRLSQWRVQIRTWFSTKVTSRCTVSAESCLAQLSSFSKRRQDLWGKSEANLNLRYRPSRFTATSSETCLARINKIKVELIWKSIQLQRMFYCRTKPGRSWILWKSFFGTLKFHQKNVYSDRMDGTHTLLGLIMYSKSVSLARIRLETHDEVYWTL